ncbi:MAG TPA: LLM class F420-dependent oxidoreductase [Acidimicrobiales bacterium]|nr:LLM class F420-dependent oxidoreductase [Acidimicrobiales bacterium]
MPKLKVGVQLHPQNTTIGEIRKAWQEADAMGVDSIWTWDHFYPLYGDPDAVHFEGWSLLAAMAVDTSHAQFGMLVTCNSYRNPDLLADMARTIDQLSGGRLILGIGAGWFERDYDEYGYEFGTAGQRLKAMEDGIARIEARLAKLNPGPAGDLPLLIGGGGVKVTLRIVAEKAQMWNTLGPLENFVTKNAVLDEWCTKVGRDPASIERTVGIWPNELDDLQAYVDAGADHLILALGPPYPMDGVQRMLDFARK